MLWWSYIEERTLKIPSHGTEEVLTMRSDTRNITFTSPAPGVTPDTITGPLSDELPVAAPNTARAREAPAAVNGTARVKVNWLIGSSTISLVWLVLVTAIVGWLLGLMASARFNWRTRAPRRQRGARS
jgi:hypothetical protein